MKVSERGRQRGSGGAFKTFVKDGQVLNRISERVLLGVMYDRSIGDHAGISSIKTQDSKPPVVPI